jgi:hypothetical protein
MRCEDLLHVHDFFLADVLNALGILATTTTICGASTLPAIRVLELSQVDVHWEGELFSYIH